MRSIYLKWTLRLKAKINDLNKMLCSKTKHCIRPKKDHKVNTQLFLLAVGLEKFRMAEPAKLEAVTSLIDIIL